MKKLLVLVLLFPFPLLADNIALPPQALQFGMEFLYRFVTQFAGAS